MLPGLVMKDDDQNCDAANRIQLPNTVACVTGKMVGSPAVDAAVDPVTVIALRYVVRIQHHETF